MMKVEIICFTAGGYEILKKLQAGFAALSADVSGYIKISDFDPEEKLPLPAGVSLLTVSLRSWTKQHFKTGSGLIFVGAAGIAVRAVAPFLKGKASDPAVAAVDELGKYVIPLLSGHLGGANELARTAARILGAEPVITTATDVRGKFAVDLFAVKNRLVVTDLTAAKMISAAVLKGEKIGFFSDFPIEGMLPKELAAGEKKRWNIRVTVHSENFFGDEAESGTLYLVPGAVVLGIGCRKGAPETAIKKLADSVFAAQKIHPAALCRIASIDLKAEEPGLLRFLEQACVPFVTFTGEELLGAEGSFTESEFVRRTTGVGNVCERAAILGCKDRGGVLLAGKSAKDGVTAAAACENTVIHF